MAEGPRVGGLSTFCISGDSLYSEIDHREDFVRVAQGTASDRRYLRLSTSPSRADAWPKESLASA